MRRFAWLLLAGLLIPSQVDAQSYGSRFAAIAQRYNDTSTLVLSQAATTRPSATRTRAYNRAIVGLKSYGIWQKLDTLYLLAAADNQIARLNLKDPATFTALAVNSPTFTVDRGYTGDGSSSRVRTQYTPSTNGVNYVKDNASIWAWVLNNSQVNSSDVGNVTAPRAAVSTRTTSDLSGHVINDGTTSNTASTDSTGLFGATRAAAGTKKAWKNGLQDGADISVASTAVASQEQWMCGANSSSFSTHQMAAAAWGASLTGLELQFYNVLLPYMQSVGASP